MNRRCRVHCERDENASALENLIVGSKEHKMQYWNRYSILKQPTKFCSTFFFLSGEQAKSSSSSSYRVKFDFICTQAKWTKKIYNVIYPKMNEFRLFKYLFHKEMKKMNECGSNKWKKHDDEIDTIVSLFHAFFLLFFTFFGRSAIRIAFVRVGFFFFSK